MARKFVLKNQDLHSTRGGKPRVKFGLTGIVFIGIKFCKKANMWCSFKNFNTEGKTNIIGWYSTRSEVEKQNDY